MLSRNITVSLDTVLYRCSLSLHMHKYLSFLLYQLIQQSISQRNQTKKREKKLRAEQRLRQERLGNVSSGGGPPSSDDEFTVVADVVGTLKI